ncbi:DUF2130 domain-containing protein [Candidatus Saccharibacteria bacterium]|nr:DUF2130 domain-containing protein [Candidatus Saccharibacteria bacterium]
MAEIKCPKCGTSFKVDESGYTEILKQVRNEEFSKDLAERERLLMEKHRSQIELLKKQSETEIAKDLNKKEQEIAKVREKALIEINKLKAQIATSEAENRLAISEAVNQAEKERDRFKNDLLLANEKAKNAEANLKEKYEAQLKSKDEQIDYYKDLKTKMSTKMVGETLEQHCETEFNKLRPYAFQRAYFKKDNAISKASGSKGDYIFRDYDEDGNEIISIMFEMKNENETTSTKHKNEHFFKELDKDRKEKKCEYAVLVSLLEAESDYYNTGIVDVSYQSGFEKMYVIRPQFFMQFIALLRNAALNADSYRKELAVIKNQNLDITDFETRINEWKDSFAINSSRATKNFEKAIKEIEDSIKKLENTKQALLQTIKNFNTANNKLDDLSVKKLTRGNATMTQKFKELKNGKK